MNTSMADGAAQRLVAEMAQTLFGQPGLTLMELAEKVKEMQPAPATTVLGLRVVADPAVQPGTFEIRTPSLAGQEQARGQFEAWYVENAFDYEKNPIGSRECSLMWKAWQAALAARQPVGQEPYGWVLHAPGGPVFCPTKDRDVMEDASRPECITCVEVYNAPPAHALDLGPGVKAIADERERQLETEGFTREVDQQYRRGELAKAATAYVQLAAMDLAAGGTRDHIAWQWPAAVWPWESEWWKPVDARRDLVRAGALIAAQIDLIDSQAVRNG